MAPQRLVRRRTEMLDPLHCRVDGAETTFFSTRAQNRKGSSPFRGVCAMGMPSRSNTTGETRFSSGWTCYLASPKRSPEERSTVVAGRAVFFYFSGAA